MSALRNCIWGVVAFVASVPGQEQPKSETPRVLLIGDVSWNNHFQNAQKALKTKATVVRSPLGYLSTGASLTRIDELLQDQRWDLVCINFGLSDLMYRDPRSKRVRAMSPRAGGVQITRVEDYSKNLANLVARLRKSSSRVLWLTTMPLQPRQRTSAIVTSDIPIFNAAASVIMTKMNVEVVDVHAQITLALSVAKNQRARDRLHHDLFKKDLSAQLVTRIASKKKP